MAAARAAALGVRWLQRTTRGVVPLEARRAFHMTKDMLPGSYPRTPEERAAAAKKYNMRVEDYEPYPDDGMGYGDYPMLPNRSQHERDPWYQWDHSELRMNWGEPVRKGLPFPSSHFLVFSRGVFLSAHGAFLAKLFCSREQGPVI